jgi:ABC-type branched-subunit amino acid transport system ATPase component
MADAARRIAAGPALAVADLHVYYGRAHVLQGVSLTLERGVLAVVGRNGMGKSTLCNTIMGLVPAAAGSVRSNGIELLGRSSHAIVNTGIGYVPQGRRVWPSLTVDEHLRLAARRAKGEWTVDRIYNTFPALAERRRHGGAQLSGGEQQMLAISRALLANPRLLVMDEPTEGLAPVIVDRLSDTLRRLAADGQISVLLIEQNLGVATAVASRVAIMVNGRLVREMSARDLANDHGLQQRLLGVQTHEGETDARAEMELEAAPQTIVYQVRRQAETDESEMPGGPSPVPVVQVARAPNRWTQANPLAARREATAEELMTQDPVPEPAPPRWARPRWRAAIRKGRLPSSPATAAAPSPPWPRRSSTSSSPAAISLASSPPAAPAARRWRHRPCAACRWASPR